MSDLTFIEKSRLERLFDMQTGYVLDFTNRTFDEFVQDAVRRNIYDQRYDYATGSKANRLRQFWKVESNHVVGALLDQLIDYATTLESVDSDLVPACKKVAARLRHSAPVSELDAIAPIADDRTFEALAKSVRESIENNEPEAGLDRLHTFVVRYFRTVCDQHGIPTDRKRPLHSLVGEYLKRLRSEGLVESDMTERIIKSSISTLESFNHVRNENSFAHDNPILSYDESLFIFNHVCALIRFIRSVEQGRKEQNYTEPEDELPF